jgi:DNA topoisomerase 2-associated protein PAT1
VVHPFIAIISHAKGKKALHRAWNLLPPQQRTIVVTIIIVHLDSLDVVHNALTWPIPVAVKDEIVLFTNTVMQRVFNHIYDAELHIVLGLLGLVISRTDIRSVVRTEVGLHILTALISRAEVLKEEFKQPNADQQQLLHEYAGNYTNLFNAIEPILPIIFPDTNPIASDDVYVWQFLAAMGAAANAEQQQRLVIGVKDRVMSAVQAARTLPNDAMEKRKGEVNIFMRALGLDVDLLI